MYDAPLFHKISSCAGMVFLGIKPHYILIMSVIPSFVSKSSIVICRPVSCSIVTLKGAFRHACQTLSANTCFVAIQGSCLSSVTYDITSSITLSATLLDLHWISQQLAHEVNDMRFTWNISGRK